MKTTSPNTSNISDVIFVTWHKVTVIFGIAERKNGYDFDYEIRKHAKVIMQNTRSPNCRVNYGSIHHAQLSITDAQFPAAVLVLFLCEMLS